MNNIINEVNNDIASNNPVINEKSLTSSIDGFVSAETNSEEPKYQFAAEVNNIKHVVDEWSSAVTKEFDGRNKLQMAVLVDLYKLCWLLSRSGTDRSNFLKGEKIRPHGKCTNWVQPIVRKLLLNTHEACRSQVTKFSGAIRLAIDNATEPEELSAFLLENGGYTTAYQKFAESLDNNGDHALSDKIGTRELVEDYLCSDPPSDEFNTPDLLTGFIGRQLVIVQIIEPSEENQEGRFQILKRFNYDEVDINKFLEREANKSIKRPQKGGHNHGW
jgi:hypothetical protein